MRQIAPVSDAAVESIKRRRELLGAAGELADARRKLARTERALDSLSRIFSLIPDPIEIVAPDHTIVFANRASRLLHDNDQLEGTTYYRSVMGLDAPPDECPIRRAVEDDREAAFTAASDTGEVFEVAVTPVVLSDGRRAAMCYSKPVASAAPEETADSGAGGDEADLLRRIAELSSLTLDAVLDQIGDGVLMIDLSGEPIVSNRAFREMVGAGSDAPLNAAAVSRILFPARADGACPVEALAELAAGEGGARFETSIAAHNGERIPVEMAASRVPVGTGTGTALLVTVRDLREETEIKDQLIKAFNLSLAGERIAALAHQVNNYLTPAFYHTDKLARRNNLDRATRQSVSTIQNYLNLCHESISMVLSLIRPAVPGPIDMNHLISEVFSRHYLADELRLDNIEVVQRYDPAMVETTGYRVLLQQALANIIKNAREAMVQANGGGRLMVLTEATPSTITVRISDNGPGIPEDVQKKIFDLAFTSKPNGEGSGIGLHFAREVIARHDGTIAVKSRPGQGATFVISLPVRPPEAGEQYTAREAETAPPPGAETGRETGRILIIDDEPGIADLLSDILSAEGHEVTASLDAQDALEKIRTTSFDCVVCDIRMPDMDGPTFAGFIRDHHAELYDRLVFITGDIFNQETGAFIDAAGAPCIEKPFTSEEVNGVVRRILSRRRACG